MSISHHLFTTLAIPLSRRALALSGMDICYPKLSPRDGEAKSLRRSPSAGIQAEDLRVSAGLESIPGFLREEPGSCPEAPASRRTDRKAEGPAEEAKPGTQ